MREVLKWKSETVLATVFSSLDFSCNNKPFFSENRHYTIIQTDKSCNNYAGFERPHILR